MRQIVEMVKIQDRGLSHLKLLDSAVIDLVKNKQF